MSSDVSDYRAANMNDSVNNVDDNFEEEEETTKTMSNRTNQSPSPNSSNVHNNSLEPPRPPPTSKPPSYTTQIKALLLKNAIIKRRNPFHTFLELFSPVLLMMVLVLGYNLSEVTMKNSRMYSSLDLDLPGGWLGVVDGVRSLNDNGDLGSGAGGGGRMLKHHLDRMSDILSVHKTDEDELLDGDDGSSRRLQTGDDDGDDDGGDVGGNDIDNIFSFFNDARKQLNEILRSPIPIPTISQYLTINNLLSSVYDPSQINEVISNVDLVRQWGNLLTLGTLHLSPQDDPKVEEFRNYLNVTYGGDVANRTFLVDGDDDDDADGLLRIRVHHDEESGLDYINDNLNERAWALINFDNDEATNPKDFRYTIRMNYTTLPNTNRITKFVSIGLDKDYQRYYLSGYLTLQRTLNEFAFNRMELGGSDQDDMCVLPSENDWDVFSMPMSTAAYSQNAFFQAVGFLLGLTIAMAYLYPTSRLVKNLVEEKETRMKETLSILGVHPTPHFLSWILTSLLTFLIITITISYTLSSNILKHSSSLFIFAYIGLFSTSTLSFCFFISSFFSRAKLAAMIGPVSLFATLLPRYIFFGTNRYEATSGKMWSSLLPCTAFAFGADIVADYEYAELGVNGDNLWEGEYSFGTVLVFLGLDTVLFMLLFWYVGKVVPREYGVVGERWYFLLDVRYWRRVLGLFGRTGKDQVFLDQDIEMYSRDNPNFEINADPSLMPRVQIRNLVKRYNNNLDKPPAVNNLNLNMYEGQITCLLGHNGAGKTSTISVLTGLFPPTSGDCYIYNNSIKHSLHQARQSMGICPQQNILFPSLTVLEHLQFFHRIKGLHPDSQTLQTRANEVGLHPPLHHVKSSNLSGGNKRKLSLAIALCGNPRFLLLDEPTSGMDPYSRRSTWELLRRKRDEGDEKRVILLTTHFMDEAELLADRIAVMKEGGLQCCGSGLFLKERFGVGYVLTVVVVADDDDQHGGHGEQIASLSSSSASLNNNNTNTSDNMEHHITEFLREHIPKTILTRKSARELTYRFPQGSEDSFPALFDALEKTRDGLGIGGYGVSNTTLEEVFLRLAEEDEGASASDDDMVCDEERALGNISGPGRYGAISPSLHQDVPDVTKKLQDDQSTTGDGSTTKTFESKRTLDSSDSSRTSTHSPPLATTSETLHDIHEESSSPPLQYTNWRNQILLLVHKRILSQKRDWKGTFFMLVLPVLLIALVLLILMLPVPFAGGPLELDVDLYDSSRTDILLGLGDSSSTAVVDRMKTEFQSQYPHSTSVSDKAEIVFEKERAVIHFGEEFIPFKKHGERYFMSYKP